MARLAGYLSHPRPLSSLCHGRIHSRSTYYLFYSHGDLLRRYGYGHVPSGNGTGRGTRRECSSHSHPEGLHPWSTACNWEFPTVLGYLSWAQSSIRASSSLARETLVELFSTKSPGHVKRNGCTSTPKLLPKGPQIQLTNMYQWRDTSYPKSCPTDMVLELCAHLR